MNRILSCGLFWMMIMLAACSNDKRLDEMERIKEIGDENPQEALLMLDSLRHQAREGSDYVQAKYDLLEIRLNDKADNMPKSDIDIKRLVEYFEKEGSKKEKQEVYYYAGSVYRDLQDTPLALANFFKSLDYAEDNVDCDSIMLRNTYSNLTYLQYRVQNYNEAVDMAKKELTVCKRLNKEVIIPYMHLSEAYLGMDVFLCAKSAMDSAYAYIIHSKDISLYQSNLVHLMCHYSDLQKYSVFNDMSKAKACFSMINNNPLENFEPFPCIAFAQYYESIGKEDSAAIYCQRVLDDGTSIDNMYDAAKMLYRIYSRKDDVHKAKQYADIYIQLGDSLDLGKRQELAATVNNQYKYQWNQKKEQRLKEEKERYRNMLVMVVLAAMLLISLGYILYIKKRNKHLRQVLTMSSELQKQADNERLLNETIEQRERQLEERMAQNKRLVNQLHQAELAEKAEDVIESIRLAAAGKKSMSSADWKQLYKAVDELYPELKEKLLAHGSLTDQQVQVCYLMRIGLSNVQIQNMTELSRTTVWRWIKKFSEVHGCTTTPN